MIPVGAPDDTARRAIWRRYIPGAVAEAVDVAALVAATDLFTPADIEFAARKGSQRAFEQATYGVQDARPDPVGPSTEDYLAAVGQTRPTLTQRIVDEFTEDIATLGRL